MLVGVLTGAVASEKSNEAARWWAQSGRKSLVECNGISPPTARLTSRAETKVGHSGSGGPAWKAIAQRIKGTPGDNRLMTPRVHIDGVVWHLDVRLIASWGWSRSQGFGFSPIKAVRDWFRTSWRQFGPICRGCRNIDRNLSLSTRGPGWTYLWWTVVLPRACRVAIYGRDNR